MQNIPSEQLKQNIEANKHYVDELKLLLQVQQQSTP